MDAIERLRIITADRKFIGRMENYMDKGRPDRRLAPRTSDEGP